MQTLRPGNKRGHVNYGWLDSYHTFSFDTYIDERFMGYGAIKVINEDKIAAGKGFPFHSHKNMEIVSYVVKGRLEHRDSLGNTGVIHAGEVQRMSAGTGITHGELNPAVAEETHLLQIWILPQVLNLQPDYQQKNFESVSHKNMWRLLVSTEGENGSLKINQKVRFSDLFLENHRDIKFELNDKSLYWLQIIGGEISIDDTKLIAGDGMAIEKERGLLLKAASDATLLLIETYQ